MALEIIMAITLQNRKVCKKILDSLDEEQINFLPAGFNNNILWNCAHIIAVQQILTYGRTNQPFALDKDWVMRFKPGTKPEGNENTEVINEVKSMLFTSYEKLNEDIVLGKFVSFNPFLTALNFEVNDLESALTFNLYHEALHMGHMLNIKKFL